MGRELFAYGRGSDRGWIAAPMYILEYLLR